MKTWFGKVVEPRKVVKVFCMVCLLGQECFFLVGESRTPKMVASFFTKWTRLGRVFFIGEFL